MAKYIIEVLDENQIPELFIAVDAMAMVQQYVAQCSKEIGWMGQIELTEREGESPMITLINPYAVPQEVSHTTTDLDADGIGEWALTLKSPETIKWWGHSHVNMACNPSSTDMITFNEHIENDPESPFIMTIHNKSGEMFTNFYLGHGLFAKNPPVRINYGNDIHQAAAEKHLKDNIREAKTYVRSTPANRHNPSAGIGFNAVQHNGGGSNRIAPIPPASQVRNAQRNLMGLRQH